MKRILEELGGQDQGGRAIKEEKSFFKKKKRRKRVVGQGTVSQLDCEK